MAAQQGVDVITDDVATDDVATDDVTNNDDITGDITSPEQDLSRADVKQEVDAEGPCLPAFAFVRVKEEPVDCDETSTQDDAFSENVDVPLPPIEEVLVDPPPVKTEPNSEDTQGDPQLDTHHQNDPLMSAEEASKEAETKLPFAGTATTHAPTKKKSATKKRSRKPGAKLHRCVECGYSTSYSSNLAKHNKVHTGEKPYACSECDYRTTLSSNLEGHKRIHTGEKPYACTECEYRTAQSGCLARHKRSHTGEKPYGCGECDFRAAHSGSLARHRRCHTGEKPYACAECDYRTAVSSSLARHERNHSSREVYACTECDYRSPQSWNLARHKKTHVKAETREDPCLQ